MKGCGLVGVRESGDQHTMRIISIIDKPIMLNLIYNAYPPLSGYERIG